VSAAAGGAKQEKSAGSSFLELVVIVVVALGLALGIQAFLVKPYRIPSESMVPTLKIGQRVLVNRIGNRFNDPKVGDIVVFHPPRGAEPGDSGLEPNVGSTAPGICADTDSMAEGKPCAKSVGGTWDSENYIKRVVAGPGDLIAVREGRVILNGKRVKEPYISDTCDGQTTEGGPCTLPNAIRVPAGHYYMMGDNRGESNDSRFWGPVPRDAVVGKAFATYWPPNRIGGV
jgi:signal peptidase I